MKNKYTIYFSNLDCASLILITNFALNLELNQIKIMVLSEMPTGSRAVVVRVRGRGAFRRRIMEMGFVRGKVVEVVRNAPLRDPVEYRVMGYDVSLRRSEASMIEVALSNGAINEGSAFTGEIQVVHHRWRHGKHRRYRHMGSHTIYAALVGNPNCGKTTIFNIASNSHEHVGNYAGVTISSKTARFRWKKYAIQITDLPGTYSLSSYSPEEKYVFNYLTKESPDVVINVVDASNLERNLYLTTQLIDMDVPMILVLNMYDELLAKGYELDCAKLEQLLGIPVVPTVGTRGEGIDKLLERIVSMVENREEAVRHIHIKYDDEIEASVHTLQDLLWKKAPEGILTLYPSRLLALHLLENDSYVHTLVKQFDSNGEIAEKSSQEQLRLKKLFGTEVESVITSARYGFIEGALQETLKHSKKIPRRPADMLDNIFLHKYWGFPVFFIILALMFQGTFVLGKYPVQWIESLVAWISMQADVHMAEGPLKDLLIQGILGGVGGVIVFLPNILILFLFIAFLEDTGYLARVAFIMDRVMHPIGLHGKSFIPLIMGFGCNVPAIMATRTIENRNDRLLTMLINPFMSCSARLPVYILLIGLFFPQHAGMVLFGLYLTGILLAAGMALILKRIFFRGKGVPFVMELPPYRMPTTRALIKHMWSRAGQYLKKMGTVILVASILIWALGNFPKPAVYKKDYLHELNKARIEKMQLIQRGASKDQVEKTDNLIQDLRNQIIAENQQFSVIGRAGKWIEPILTPLGFDWRIGVCLMSGIVAKEVIVSTMGVLFAGGNTSQKTSFNEKLLEAVWTDGPRAGNPLFTPLTALTLMVFVLIYFPCVAVVAAIRNESGSWKWAAFAVTYTTVLAWVVALIVRMAGSLFFS